jgi:hypothetical protein
MTISPQPRIQIRVPHVRDSFIVANVGMFPFLEPPANPPPPEPSKVEVEH